MRTIVRFVSRSQEKDPARSYCIDYWGNSIGSVDVRNSEYTAMLVRPRLLSIFAGVCIAVLSCGCTRQFTNGKITVFGPTVRPGGPPVGGLSVALGAGGPSYHRFPAWVTRECDPDTPKGSNGGSGTEQVGLAWMNDKSILKDRPLKGNWPKLERYK